MLTRFSLMTWATLFSWSTGWTPALIDDGEGAEIVRRVGDDVAVWRDDVEPLGEEEVDLLDVLLERGVAGGVVVDVVGGAQTFTSVHGDVGGLERGLAMGGDGGLLAGFEGGLGVAARAR